MLRHSGEYHAHQHVAQDPERTQVGVNGQSIRWKLGCNAFGLNEELDYSSLEKSHVSSWSRCQSTEKDGTVIDD
jgi:hypothetical protein